GLDRWGHGGPLVVGAPANVAIIDPAAEWTVRTDELATRSSNNPFRGRTLTGRVLETFLRGERTWSVDRSAVPA
ncbi:MAG: dihydroorotase, partial [Actinomycetota bacterium]